MSFVETALVAECPSCGAADPDPADRGFCPVCGAVFREKVRKRLRAIRLAAWAGMLLALGGGALFALVPAWSWVGLLMALLGLIAMVRAMYGIRRHSRSLLTALEISPQVETSRLLASADSLALMLLIFFVASAVACGMSVPLASRQKQREAIEVAFDGHLEQYAELIDEEPRQPDATSFGRLPGKVLVLERDQGQVSLSEAHFDLPENVRAEHPEQVAAVAWLEYEQVRVGTYQPGNYGAYRIDARMTLVDRKEPAVLDVQEFKGGNPPEAVTGGDAYGERPYQAIAEYLAARAPN